MLGFLLQSWELVFFFNHEAAKLGLGLAREMLDIWNQCYLVPFWEKERESESLVNLMVTSVALFMGEGGIHIAIALVTSWHFACWPELFCVCFGPCVLSSELYRSWSILSPSIT